MNSPYLPVPVFESFTSIAGDRVRLRHLSKATLLDLSHLLEDMVEDHTREGVVVTGFQYARNWLAEVDRYERLARTDDRKVAIFTRDRVPEPVSVVPFRIPAGSSLCQEWFVLVHTPVFSCALFGIDQQPGEDASTTPGTSELDRQFLAGWTFDAALVREFGELVVTTASASDAPGADELAASLQAITGREISPELAQHFYMSVFECMERDKVRMRASHAREARAALQLRQSTARMVRLERLSTLGTTTATFAHEVNNPLQIVIGHADSVRFDLEDLQDLEAVLAEPHRAALARCCDSIAQSMLNISDAAQRIGRLTRGVLDIARQEDVRLRSTDLGTWLEERLARIAESVGASATLDPVAEGLVAHIDDDRFVHLLANLMKNAAEADTHSPAQIEVSCSAQGDVLRVRVRDHGPGIEESLRTRLFEPFVSSKLAQGGSGLGLALSRRFAEDMQARLELAFSGPDGSAFDILLPLRPADPLAAAQFDRTAATPADTTNDATLVLVLDDDPLVRRLICSMLQRNHMLVTEAGSEAEAEQAMVEDHFDLLVVDHQLNGARTGTQLLQDWSRRGLVRPQRCLLVSGNLESSLGDGAEGAQRLLKPFDERTLVSTLQAMLAHARTTQS